MPSISLRSDMHENIRRPHVGIGGPVACYAAGVKAPEQNQGGAT